MLEHFPFYLALVVLIVLLIMLGNKIVKEIHNVFAKDRVEAIANAWQSNAAQPYRDGKHEAKAYA